MQVLQISQILFACVLVLPSCQTKSSKKNVRTWQRPASEEQKLPEPAKPGESGGDSKAEAPSQACGGGQSYWQPELPLSLAKIKREDSEVIKGKNEKGFPFVVPIKNDGGGSCTGSFVSDSLLLTAAHCVGGTKHIYWENAKAGKEDIFIHPGWPQEKNCGIKREPKYDVALVRFPPNTYCGPIGQLTPIKPQVGDLFMIVGFGNNNIIPFEKYCTLEDNVNEHGYCQVLAGTRTGKTSYRYVPVHTFVPQNASNSSGCADPCTSSGFKNALSHQGHSYSGFVKHYCDGNFRDRSYRETGSGTRRSGYNKVSAMGSGTIYFYGSISGEPTGIGVVSGAGDSGGPLFLVKDGQPHLAAITHGGSLTVQNNEMRKRSIYVDLTVSHNLEWLRAIVKEKNLRFPSLN